jgi:hypothetical protein
VRLRSIDQDEAMPQLIIALILLAHGIGHIMGPLQTFRLATINPRWKGDSWLLSRIAGQTLTQAVGVVLWTAALVLFAILAAVAMGWLPATWWQPLAVVASVTSLAAVALFPTAFPTFSTIGAVVVDVAVLAAALVLEWGPADLSS